MSKNCPYCGKEFPNRGIGAHIWRVHGEGRTFHPPKGMTPWNKGKTKHTDIRLKEQSDKYRALIPSWQLELDDDGKLRQKYYNKRVNAKKEGVKCLITFYEYCMLLKQCNLKSSDLGYTGNGYVLSRNNDTGDYVIGNCTFVTQKENMAIRNSHM